jgi:hypothetical protein
VIGISTISIAVWTHTHSRLTSTGVSFYVPSATSSDAHVTGECFERLSIADNGAQEAHRCFSGNGKMIYDPCFDETPSNEAANKLVCVASPWTQHPVVLAVTKWMIELRGGKLMTFGLRDPRLYKYAARAFGPRGSVRKSPPWALDLVGGIHCLYATGATWTLRDRRANYLCGRGDLDSSHWWKAAGVVIGLPLRHTGSPWEVVYLPPGGTQSHQAAVVRAWF